MISPPDVISYAEAVRKLDLIGQRHLLNFWTQLTFDQKNLLLQQINHLDCNLFAMQQRVLQKARVERTGYAPFHDYVLAGNLDDHNRGLKLIADGQMGCVIVAGGQGTRLRSNAPKGMFPVTPIKHKTLFQLFAEKTLAASKLARLPLQIAVMTSPQNHVETQEFFYQHQYFGLEPTQLSFFSQAELPLLDSEGQMKLCEIGSIAMGPDGNGSCLSHFVKSLLWQAWWDKGIRFLNFIQIDNALADPFDAELLGFHVKNGAEIAIKCIERRFPEEKLGLLVKTQKTSIEIIEYSEMAPSEREARAPDGLLQHRCANISAFCFAMEFVASIAVTDSLPWHLANKACAYVDKQGKKVIPQKPNLWKFEHFIFDVLPCASRVFALLNDRKSCFAPLKNDNGECSLQTVQDILMSRDAWILEKITGRKIPPVKIELSQEFYYPTSELLHLWYGREVTNGGYIS